MTTPGLIRMMFEQKAQDEKKSLSKPERPSRKKGSIISFKSSRDETNVPTSGSSPSLLTSSTPSLLTSSTKTRKESIITPPEEEKVESNEKEGKGSKVRKKSNSHINVIEGLDEVVEPWSLTVEENSLSIFDKGSRRTMSIDESSESSVNLNTIQSTTDSDSRRPSFEEYEPDGNESEDDGVSLEEESSEEEEEKKNEQGLSTPKKSLLALDKQSLSGKNAKIRFVKRKKESVSPLDSPSMSPPPSLAGSFGSSQNASNQIETQTPVISQFSGNDISLFQGLQETMKRYNENQKEFQKWKDDNNTNNEGWQDTELYGMFEQNIQICEQIIFHTTDIIKKFKDIDNKYREEKFIRQQYENNLSKIKQLLREREKDKGAQGEDIESLFTISFFRKEFSSDEIVKIKKLQKIIRKWCRERKRRRNWEKAVAEIINTERNYFRGIVIIKDKFVEPLSSEENNSMVSKEELSHLFGNINAIISITKQFLGDLEQLTGTSNNPNNLSLESQMKSLPSDLDLGQLYLKHAELFRVYTGYVGNFKLSMKTLTLCSKRSIFSNWLKSVESGPDMNGLFIGDFLILPVKHVPRYLLLLQNLLRFTPPGTASESLTQSLQKVREIADFINEKQRQAENVEKIIEIQSKLSADAPSLSGVPGRIFVREGLLRVVTTPDTSTTDLSITQSNSLATTSSSNLNATSSSISTSGSSTSSSSGSSSISGSGSGSGISASGSGGNKGRLFRGNTKNSTKSIQLYLFTDILICARKTHYLQSVSLKNSRVEPLPDFPELSFAFRIYTFTEKSTSSNSIQSSNSSASMGLPSSQTSVYKEITLVASSNAERLEWLSDIARVIRALRPQDQRGKGKLVKTNKAGIQELKGFKQEFSSFSKRNNFTL